MQKKKKLTRTVRMSLRKIKSLDKRKSTAGHQFSEDQFALVASLVRKHSTVLLVTVGKYVCLALEHWRYLIPTREARMLKLYKGKVFSNGKPQLYLYDIEQFKRKNPR